MMRSSCRSLPLLLIVVTVGACGSSAPITIEAEKNLAPVTCAAALRAEVVDVVDRRGYGDAMNIGFTQTGLFNKHTSLVASPSAPALIRDSITAALQSCASGTTSAEPPLSLKIELVTFQVTEKTGLVSEEIRADLGYAVKAFSSDGSRFLESFDVEGAASRTSGLDTTPFADDVVNEALRIATQEFVRQFAQTAQRHAD